MSKSVFIFRRDYRTDDNIGFIECCKASESVLPVFIFTPEQSKKKENPYFSDNSFQFLIESLEELSNDFPHGPHGLLMLQEDNVKALKELKKEYDFNAIYTNRDYTPYAIDRDEEIRKYCESENIEFHNEFEDYLLAPMNTFLKGDGKPYTKYTPFKNNAYKFNIPKPTKCSATLLKKCVNIKSLISKIKCVASKSDIDKLYEKNEDIIYHGGRSEGLKRLSKISDFKKYETERNVLSKSTTLLSAYINFGCVSIRECFWTITDKLGKTHGLNNQLLWREFWYYIGFYFPHVINYKGKNKNMWPEYDGMKWKNSQRIFDAWCEGRTGFPAVDAGMRELNTTGYMHNRARLITSGILVKNFGIDWRWGETYFSQKLIDINAPVNNGNWQWSASTGENKGEYYRIMNPWTQSEKFDKDASYIKKWIPELASVDAKDIHHWDISCNDEKYKNIDYPKPIIEYGPEMRKEIMDMYKSR
jgi:deoxyribodipyrimidine photo-lyase